MPNGLGATTLGDPAGNELPGGLATELAGMAVEAEPLQLQLGAAPVPAVKWHPSTSSGQQATDQRRGKRLLPWLMGA